MSDEHSVDGWELKTRGWCGHGAPFEAQGLRAVPRPYRVSPRRKEKTPAGCPSFVRVNRRYRGGDDNWGRDYGAGWES
jgi:hypothetical protein